MAFTTQASLLGFLCILGELSCAIAMLFVVSENLWHVSVFSTSSSTTIYGQCFLQADYNNVWSSTCNYAYSLASFSVLLTVMMFLVGNCSSQPGARFRMALYNSIILFVWWVVGASIVTNSITGANNANVPQEYWRQVMLGLLWAEVGLFAISIFTDWKQLDSFVYTIQETQQLHANNAGPNQQSMYAQAVPTAVIYNNFPAPYPSSYPPPPPSYPPQTVQQGYYTQPQPNSSRQSPFASAQTEANQASSMV